MTNVTLLINIVTYPSLKNVCYATLHQDVNTLDFVEYYINIGHELRALMKIICLKIKLKVIFALLKGHARVPFVTR